MKLRGVVLTAAILFLISAPAKSDEQKLGVTVDATYVTRYLWRGMDTYPQNHSATQPSIDIDLYGTGLGINVWTSRANGAGFRNSEEIDYTVYYCNTLFENENYAADYTVGWVIYTYPDQPRKAANMQEVFGTLSWPKILPAGFVPSYTLVCTWPSQGKSDISDYGGWLHILGLCRDLSLPGFLPGTDEQVLHLSAETIYNDGAYGASVDHDWSHAVFGVSTGFGITKNLTFTPAFYYQSSWDDSVNTQDEYWTSLSLTYEF